MIPRLDIIAFESNMWRGIMLNLAGAARVLKISRQRMQQLCAKNRIPEARKNGAHWEIPPEALLKFKKNREKLEYTRYTRPEGIISVQEAAHILGSSLAVICKYCGAGCIFGARKVGRRWEIPVDAFHDFKRRREAACALRIKNLCSFLKIPVEEQ